MSPLDRIAQLTERAPNAEKQCDIALNLCESAQREVALLRSQLSDARQQLERDSATIAKLAKDKRELKEGAAELLNAIIIWHEAYMRKTPPSSESMEAFFLPAFCKNARNFLSSHA